MAWPAGTVSTAHLDAGTDDPSSARADIKQMADYVNDIIATRGAASGICELDASSKIPVSRGPIPSGTRMLFYQTSAPTGWTQYTSGLNGTYGNMIRVVTGSGGSAGGSHSPITMDKVPYHYHGLTSGSVASSGAHTHTGGGGYAAEVIRDTPSAGTIRSGLTGDCHWTDMAMDSSGAHTHSLSGTTDGNTSSSNWTPLYADVICATKDA